jgi:hypothetical protein
MIAGNADFLADRPGNTQGGAKKMPRVHSPSFG